MKLYAYAGRRLHDRDGKLYAYFYPADYFEPGPVVEVDTKTDDYLIFDYRKITKSAALTVGAIYKVNSERPGMYKFLDRQPFMRMPNSPLAVEWAALDRVAVQEHGALSDRKTDPLLAALDPIREAYSRCVGSQRYQLIASVVAYIVGGKRK